ncbi:MAG TPA: protein kinase [Chloroflexota bacterium]|jgi:serine/threonine-protein kinase
MTPGTVVNGRYRLLAILGDGGMARVFRAEDTRLRRIVALKTMLPRYLDQPAFVQRFEQEARLAAGLSHPNIVAVYDVGSDGTTPFLVMEYVEGGSLKALIARSGPLPMPRVLPLMDQLGGALDAAHAHGVIHRDIKPENILLTSSGQIKVTDFGIARALTGPRQTATGMMLGSVSYASPEQAQGQDTSAASDLYSSGVVLYELLTGQPPFAADTPLGVAMQHVTQPPAPPSVHVPAVPAAVDEVVLRALSKDPSGRFPSGAAMARALALAAAPPSIHGAPTLRMARATPPFQARWIASLVKPLGWAAGTPLHATKNGGAAAIRRLRLWPLLVLLLLLGGSGVFAAVHGWGQGAAESKSPPPAAAPTARRVLEHPVAVATRRPASSAVPVPTASPTLTPHPVATATIAAPPSATAMASPTATVEGVSASQAGGAPPLPATASLRVTAGAGALNVAMTLQHVPTGAAVAARWTLPDGTSTVWQAGYAYSTNPTYWTYQLLAGPGLYQVAALVNGQAVGSQDFTVADQASPSPVGNQGGDGQGHGNGNGNGHDNGHGHDKGGGKGND